MGYNLFLFFLLLFLFKELTFGTNYRMKSDIWMLFVHWKVPFSIGMDRLTLWIMYAMFNLNSMQRLLFKFIQILKFKFFQIRHCFFVLPVPLLFSLFLSK